MTDDHEVGGDLFSYGCNLYGQLGVGRQVRGLRRPLAVTSSYRGGEESSGVEWGMGPCVDVAAGNAHTMALTKEVHTLLCRR